MKKLDKTLIIGIGNNTRQDDGLGWCFLDKLSEKGVDDNHLLYKYQLMVEDAELISNFTTVFFVDANKTSHTNGFCIERLYPSEKVAFSTHAVPPNQILNLCQNIYHKKPTAYVIKIDGYLWDFKIGLSQKASENLLNAYTQFMNDFIIKK